MSERDPAGAARKVAESFADSYRKVAGSAAEAQQRNVQLAQGWVEGLSGLLESQAEANRAFARAMESYVEVVGEALESQEKTNRALAESLDSYREVAERVAAVQQQNEDLIRGFLGDVTGELESQAESGRDLIRTLTESSEKQVEAFQEMLQGMMGSYAELLNAPFTFYQKNLEAFGKKGE